MNCCFCEKELGNPPGKIETIEDVKAIYDFHRFTKYGKPICEDCLKTIGIIGDIKRKIEELIIHLLNLSGEPND